METKTKKDNDFTVCKNCGNYYLKGSPFNSLCHSCRPKIEKCQGCGRITEELFLHNGENWCETCVEFYYNE